MQDFRGGWDGWNRTSTSRVKVCSNVLLSCHFFDNYALITQNYFIFPFEFRKMNANHSSERPVSLYGQSLHNNSNTEVSI